MKVSEGMNGCGEIRMYPEMENYDPFIIRGSNKHKYE